MNSQHFTLYKGLKYHYSINKDASIFIYAHRIHRMLAGIVDFILIGLFSSIIGGTLSFIIIGPIMQRASHKALSGNVDIFLYIFMALVLLLLSHLAVIRFYARYFEIHHATIGQKVFSLQYQLTDTTKPGAGLQNKEFGFRFAVGIIIVLSGLLFGIPLLCIGVFQIWRMMTKSNTIMRWDKDIMIGYRQKRVEKIQSTMK